MKIAIIGATGFVGAPILNEAVMRGHQVVALCRGVNKLSISELVTPIKLDITDKEKLTIAIKDCDVVVHAFAAPRIDSIEERIAKQTEATKHIIEATKAAGIKRLVAVGGAGTSEIAPGVLLMNSYFFPPAYEGGAKATAVVKTLLEQESELNWVFICPPNILESGHRTGKYRTGRNNLIIEMETGRSYISVADYSVAMLDEIEHPIHFKEHFTVGY